jgi:hypothetical protein
MVVPYVREHGKVVYAFDPMDGQILLAWFCLVPATRLVLLNMDLIHLHRYSLYVGLPHLPMHANLTKTCGLLHPSTHYYHTRARNTALLCLRSSTVHQCPSYEPFTHPSVYAKIITPPAFCLVPFVMDNNLIELNRYR